MQTCGRGISGDTVSRSVWEYDTPSLPGSMQEVSSSTEMCQGRLHVFLCDIDSAVIWHQMHVLEGKGIILGRAQIRDQASLSP